MSNSGLIVTRKKDLAVYLHWNGGRDSVEAFLEYCSIKGYRSPDQDCYGWARLCQVIGNFMGGSCSVGIDSYSNSCYSDHGEYIIEGWKIIGRGNKNIFFEQSEYDRIELLKAINKSQPESEQIPDGYFDAQETEINLLQVGQVVYHQLWDGQIIEAIIVGFGDGMVNGTNRSGQPHIDYYNPTDAKNNCNNYFNTPTVRVKA